MIEAFWNSLCWEQQLGLIILLTAIPMGIYLHIESCGGWTLYRAQKRRAKRKGNKA
jgi:hypothetical protein